MRDHIRSLDGLRGIAVILVLLHHCRLEAQSDSLGQFSAALQAGYFGVDLFFVLSGFLITRVLLSAKERKHPLSHFFIKRTLRIFPIYYVTLCVVGLIAAGPALWYSAFYLSNFHFSVDASLHPLRHTWSLAVEEHFYLVWPFVVYACAPRRIRQLLQVVILPGIIALGVIAVVSAPSNPLYLFFYRGTFFRGGSMALGAWMALRESNLREDTRSARRDIVVSLMIGLGCMLPMHSFAEHSPHFQFFRMIAFASLSYAIVLASVTLQAGNFVDRMLSFRPLVFVGRISYGLYLFHYPIFFFMFDYRYRTLGVVPDPLVIVFALVISVGLASASFYTIERQILACKDRLLPKAAPTCYGSFGARE